MTVLKKCQEAFFNPFLFVRSLFGKAFEQAALRSHSDMVADCFHSATVSILPEQLGPFLDALTTLLT